MEDESPPEVSEPAAAEEPAAEEQVEAATAVEGEPSAAPAQEVAEETPAVEVAPSAAAGEAEPSAAPAQEAAEETPAQDESQLEVSQPAAAEEPAAEEQVEAISPEQPMHTSEEESRTDATEAGTAGEGCEPSAAPAQEVAEEAPAAQLAPTAAAGEGEPSAAPVQEAAEETPAQAPADVEETSSAADAVLPRDDEAGECAIDFVILPEGYGQTKQIEVKRSIGEIRADLETELSIPDGSLYLMNMSGAVERRDVLPDSNTLLDIGVKAGDKIGIELRINYYQEQPVEEYVMPDTLELRVVDAKGVEKMVVVHVQRPVVEKPYLGGYRNKLNNASYHHAVTQTAPQQKKEVHMIRFHREAQTYEYRTRSTQCTKDNGTQMSKPGLHISTQGDKLMTPRKPYFSSADKAALVTEQCVIVQCHARGMFARRRARQKRAEKKDREELEQKEAEKRRLEADLKHKREIERRMHPRTYDDFAVLHKELEAWRLNEASRIANAGHDETTRRGAHKELLQKQTQLLQTIDKLRIKAHAQNKDAKIKKKLESMAKPKVWAQGDGETTTVHTPFSTRAKELMDLYSGLRLPLLTVDERLDVLLHVKWTVKEFDCNLTREIVDLIDREADMLNRGRPEKSFVGVRKRLANLFLQFTETPEFNPEALRFQKVSRELYDSGSNHPLSTVLIKGLP